MNKACFLDRDGVVNEEVNYLHEPEKVKLCTGTVEAIKLLRQHGYKVIVISNQSGVARGYFSVEELKSVEARLNELLAEQGVSIDATYYCFHYPEGSIPEYAKDCDCRKPKPGMLLQAAKDFDIDLSSSFMIGDRISDLEAGFNAGCPACALVRSGHGAGQDLSKIKNGGTALDTAEIYDAVCKLLALTDKEPSA